MWWGHSEPTPMYVQIWMDGDWKGTFFHRVPIPTNQLWLTHEVQALHKILTIESKGVQLSVVCKMQMLFSFFYKL